MAQAPGWGDRCSHRALLASGFLEPREPGVLRSLGDLAPAVLSLRAKLSLPLQGCQWEDVLTGCVLGPCVCAWTPCVVTPLDRLP